MKVGIIGLGQLGRSLTAALSERGVEHVAFRRPELDVTDIATITRALAKHQPDIVVNTAAYHQVDLCEDAPGETFLVNTVGARNVAVACKHEGAIPVYISSDYVFDGAKKAPYVEGDNANPLSVYGASKLAAERMTQMGMEKFFIVRTTGLYAHGGSAGKGGNFVETMIRLGKSGSTIEVVDDQVLTPTYAADLAETICDLIETSAFGLYHMTNTGHVSWYGFAEKIFQLTNVSADLKSTTTVAYGARAARPAYSVLDNARLRDTGLAEMRPWEEALADYLGKRSQQS